MSFATCKKAHKANVSYIKPDQFINSKTKACHDTEAKHERNPMSLWGKTQSLKEELSGNRHVVHEKKHNVQNLQLQLEALTASNQMLQAMLFLGKNLSSLLSII